MNCQLTIQGALANTESSVSTEELLYFLKENTRDTQFYKLTPKYGTIMHAALDWQMILGSAASIYTIAVALWNAYEKFILPIKQKKKDAFLFVAVKNEKKEFIQFAIGEEYKEKAIFIREFSQKVEIIRMSPESEHIEIDIESDIWKKV